jgi:hypothetical protein
MRATITVRDDELEQLMELVGTRNRTQAINVAIREHIRRSKLERLGALRGRVTMPTNEELEAFDEAEYRGG